MSDEQRPPRKIPIRLLLGVFAVLVLLYSFLVATRPLFGVTIVVLLYGALLLRRFVRAFERIADALERREA